MVEDVIEGTEPESNQESSIHSSVLSTWLVTFLLYMQAAFRLTDRAVSAILAFLIIFLKVLGHINRNSLVLTETFPTSLYVARKCIGSTPGVVQKITGPLSYHIQLPMDVSFDAMSTV